jgi:hypothetical protein
MPEFPVLPDIDREGVLNQIVASVAFEELALSHILNAEGEKIQYTLGTLPGLPATATVSDALGVNESVSSMLDTVLDNQMVLGSKLFSALSAATRVGVTGPTGATGATGSPTGVIGVTGVKGGVGPTGSKGAFGNAGPAGSTGPRGSSTVVGALGVTGPVGSTGTVGSKGGVGMRGGANSPITRFNGGGTNTVATALNMTSGTAYTIPCANAVRESAGNLTYDTTNNRWNILTAGTYLFTYRIVLAQGVQGSSGIQRNAETENINASICNGTTKITTARTLVEYEKMFIAKFAANDTATLRLIAGETLNTTLGTPCGASISITKLAETVPAPTPLIEQDPQDLLEEGAYPHAGNFEDDGVDYGYAGSGYNADDDDYSQNAADSAPQLVTGQQPAKRKFFRRHTPKLPVYPPAIFTPGIFPAAMA